MMKGRYFETQCLGGTASGSLDDLPRKKNGEKTADHIRIDEAVMRFRNVVNQKMASIHDFNTQVKIRMKLNSEFGLVGHLDIFPTVFEENGELIVALVELKLAETITNEWGDFCWGKPSHVDTLQLICYLTIIRHLESDLNDFQNYPPLALDLAKRGLIRAFYWVFGYRDDGFFPMEVLYTPDKVADFRESLRKTMSLVSLYTQQGWTKSPGKVCHKCPVKDCEMQGRTLKI
jgi:hypothetical protein